MIYLHPYMYFLDAVMSVSSPNMPGQLEAALRNKRRRDEVNEKSSEAAPRRKSKS